MKMKLSIILALCLITAFQYCFAQNNSDGYKVKTNNGYYSCTSNSVFKGSSGEGDNIYEVIFDMNKSTRLTDKRIVLGIRMSTVGDTELVSIARLHQSGKFVNRQAKISLTNGNVYFENVQITDISSLKNSKSAAAFFFTFICNEPVERITMLRQYDIKTITIDGHVINMQRTTAKSAEMINKLCSSLIQITGYQSSYGSGPTTSSNNRSLTSGGNNNNGYNNGGTYNQQNHLCTVCRGKGICPYCNGSKMVTNTSGKGGLSKCKACNYTGICKSCGGTGRK